MGYFYENSTPDRFQHLCQSLLASTHPNLQCFPVGQPDGGRDGWDPDSKTVLQVKFKRADEDENADWLIQALEGELPKILRLIEKGAENYVMATNARGTAHLDTGRIDKVQAWLDTKIPIPAVCFWRDEIDRRLDLAPSQLKLKYSEVLSFEDGLQIAFESVLGIDDSRQRDAIRAFVAKQFTVDETVKFKQVSLSNDLLSLFIDVPVSFPRPLLNSLNQQTRPEDLRKLINARSGHDQQSLMDFEDIDPDMIPLTLAGNPFHGPDLGAAEFLLNPAVQDHLKLVVLEGAPGQGKSTLAQYVCQIHRARYLKKHQILKSAPEQYNNAPFRLPIKVDLRDYAAFLEGSSPFAESSTPNRPRSLDVFLAQLISYNSGGIDFTPHDVLTLLKGTPSLLFLDGLDEVADITAREGLVASIGDALVRWQEFDVDLQVVVTSRPSVFGRAPSFKKYGFITLSLHNIDSERINQYAEKWVVARGLDDSEKRDVVKILGQKLELAHIRDLTRNPMQLTILLSLIHQIGHSLPDQRTDLYRRYVDLFLTREADKSVRVRENRPVLLGFIQHLAWILQTQAESSKSAGSVSSDELQDMARQYLTAGGHAVSIADDLFGGGLERIFVLVERIEGLYEFEVQPLREYFCAQHLYSTAPVGTYRDTELRGDRAQRFEALAENPLWLNVCRFYAGSCERGETGTLVYSLVEMIETGSPAISTHAKRVGLALLQDWVFSNVKYPQAQLIQAVFDDIGVHIHSTGMSRSINNLRLDPECGQDVLRAHLFSQLKTWPRDVRTSILCSVLRFNGGSQLDQEFRELLDGKVGAERTYQLVRMFRAGAVEKILPSSIWDLIVEDDPEPKELLARSAELLWTHDDLAVQIQPLVDVFVQGVLDGLLKGNAFSFSTLGSFADLLGPSHGIYMSLNRYSSDDLEDPRIKNHNSNHDHTPKSVREFLNRVGNVVLENNDESLNGSNSPKLWEHITESARESFGETWSAVSVAIHAAGIPTSRDVPAGSDQLFNSHVSLCARARAARLRRGGSAWWLEQLEHATSDLDHMMWAGLVLSWASVKNLYSLANEVNAIIASLTEDQYSALRATVSSVSVSRAPRADRKKLSSLDLRSFSNRTALLVTLVFRIPSTSLVYTSSQVKEEPFSSLLADMKYQEELGTRPQNTEELLSWARQMNTIRTKGTIVHGSIFRLLHDIRLNSKSTEKILEEPKLYPSELVTEAVYTAQRRHKPTPLQAISTKQDWVFG